MALTYDQITAITQKHFVPKLVDNVFDSDPLLQRHKKKSYVKVDGGTSIMQPLNYAQITASEWFQGADTLSTTDNDVITSAEYQWKQLYANITISRRDELMNSGDAQVINYVKSKTQIAEKTMVDKLGDGLYSAGSDPKSIVGLRVIVDSANTVGGISQSTYSWWQSQENGSTTTLTIAALQSMYNTLCINNEHPTVAMTTRSVYNLYYALLQPQQRFMDSETAKGGFQSLMFNGVPVIAGSKVPSAHWFFLNEAYLHLYVHKDEDMRFRPFQEPETAAVKTAKIFWMGAYGSSNNRMHGKFTALAS